MYLISTKNPKVRHTVKGDDTVCRLYSTGGLNKEKYVKIGWVNLPDCVMCETKKNARIPKGRP